jgi:hypothetical protein
MVTVVMGFRLTGVGALMVVGVAETIPVVVQIAVDSLIGEGLPAQLFAICSGYSFPSIFHYSSEVGIRSTRPGCGLCVASLSLTQSRIVTVGGALSVICSA